MSWAFFFSVAGAIAQLGLGVLAFTKFRRTVLGRSLALLCFCLFTWNLAGALFQENGDRLWLAVDVMTSPFTFPLVLDVVLRFVGERRTRGRLVGLAGIGALGISASGAFIIWNGESPASSYDWSAIYLVFILANFFTATFVLSRYIGRASSAETIRALLILAAFGFGTFFGLTDVLNNFNPRLPGLSGFGTFLATALLYITIARARLLGTDLSLSRGLWVMVVISVVATSVGFAVASDDSRLALTAILLAAPIAVLGVVAASEFRNRRRELKRLAARGRMSEQLAHDLKTPIASILGAAQFLEREEISPEQRTFIELIIDESRRLTESIDRYKDASPSQISLKTIDVRTFVNEWANSRRVSHKADIDDEVLQGDPVLLRAVFDNLHQNALESGSVAEEISFCVFKDDRFWRFEMVDGGGGLNPSLKETAFDVGVTTKDEGRGLGLAFCHEIAVAHGGSVTLRSTETGCIAELSIPRDFS